MTSLMPDQGPRTYVAGGRRPRRGLTQNLGEVGTILFFAGLFACVPIMAIYGLMIMMAWVVVWLLVLLILTRRNRHNRSIAQTIGEKLGLAWTKQTKTHVLTQGPFGQVDYGEHRLPGLLAASRLEEWQDGLRRNVAVLHVPADNTYVLVFSCDPPGRGLSDQDVVDQRVRKYGLFLGRLGGVRHLLSAAVTFETIEDDGRGLQREIENHEDDTAGPIPAAMFDEMIQNWTEAASPRPRAWVTLTFAGAGRKEEDVIKDLRTRVPGLITALNGTGAGVVRPVSASRLCEMVRGAYDPKAVQRLETARISGNPVPLTWEQSGPTYAMESPTRYFTDNGATHITWVVSNVPPGEVQEDNLAPLLEPNPVVPRKRIQIKYLPMDRGTAVKTGNDDVKKAESHANRVQSDEGAKAVRDAAVKTSRELSRGAGLVDYSITITATVTEGDVEQVDEVAATVENLAAACSMDVRPVPGQAVGFLATLPVGLITPRHQRMPAELTS